tara:strand:- start:4072 stop:4230 length:159 start_codon:yes stop_codon:yes gene_type:complete
MNFFKRILSLRAVEQDRWVWLRVPMDCQNLKDKKKIILEAINTLEHKIIINK